MRKMVSAAMAALAMVGGSSAIAQNKAIGAPSASIVTNPQDAMSDFSISNVGGILSELGVTWTTQQANGQAYIAAKAGGALSFVLMPTACTADGKCVGLSMVSFFEGDAHAQTIHAFNFRFAFASAGLDPSGAVYLKRYEISDYGMARGNLATSVVVFVEQALLLSQELASAGRTVSLDGQADDLSAGSLNRAALGAFTGEEYQPSTSFDRHQVSLDENADHIKALLSDTNTPRNKIKIKNSLNQ